MANGQTRQSLNATLRAYYLDWVNNWLTLASFAEYHDMTPSDAEKAIALGRKLHEQFCKDVNNE